jgi:hypothetical protein
MQVELIMNLKVDDLKRDNLETDRTTQNSQRESANENSSLIIQSMQDAIKAMDGSRKQALRKLQSKGVESE